jgi:hypothetical protein
MTKISQGAPFGRLKHTVIPIARVRVSHETNRVNGRSGWNVDYLPVGKSRWWWNWRTYRVERTEHAARLLADVLIAERSVTLSSYENSEVEL